MENQIVDLFILAGATSWLTTAVVKKDGPFSVLAKFRHFVNRQLGPMSPLACQFCTGPYVLVVVASLRAGNVAQVNAILSFFAILSLANALKGLSGEY